MSDLGNKAIMASNIQRLMNRAGKSRIQVCDDLNISYTTFTDWVKARTYPRIDKIEMMANYFGVSKAELVEQHHPFPADAIPIDLSRYHRIPILGRISAGLPLYADEHIEGYTLTDLNSGGEYFALRVQGDSMNALRINEGDIIVVRKQEEVEQGEVAVVMVDEEDATVKRFYSSDTTVTLMPQSTNPEHKPQMYDLSKTGIRILGKVVEVKFTL